MSQEGPGESRYVDDGGAAAYATHRHGPDGAMLLDPYFMWHIDNFAPDADVVDIGCGAAPWSIYAAQHGSASSVYAFDNSSEMLDQADKAIQAAPEAVGGLITLQRGYVSAIPKGDESFDLALSINVGCAIPSLDDHFDEIGRVLKPGGHAIVTAPGSLKEVFTTYGDEEDKVGEFKQTLAGVTAEAQLHQRAASQGDVLRATIASGPNGFRLVRGIGYLASGESILRKIPGLVVPNHFHSQDDYEHSMASAGLEIVELDKPRLSTSQYRPDVGLGVEYTNSNAFAIFLLRKPAA